MALTEVENLIPWERDIYLALLKQHIDEENEKVKQRERRGKIGATGGNTDGTMGSFTPPRVGGFSGNKKQPTTDRFQDRFFSSLRREDQIKGQEQVLQTRL